jgi:hypothetical protein
MSEFLSNQKEVCPHCGQLVRSRWELLTPGLVKDLAIFHEAVIRKGRNEIHLQEDCTFNKNQYNNFQKLRYFGLVAKVDEEGKKRSGKWLITRRGAQFLAGMIDIPRKVLIFNNHIQDRSDDLVFIKDIKGGMDWMVAEAVSFEPVQIAFV